MITVLRVFNPYPVYLFWTRTMSDYSRFRIKNTIELLFLSSFALWNTNNGYIVSIFLVILSIALIAEIQIYDAGPKKMKYSIRLLYLAMTIISIITYIICLV